MWLSDGWRRLLRFWVVVVALFGVSAITLQIIGPSGLEEGSAQARHAGPAAVQTASLVPIAFSTVEPATDPVIEPPGDFAETSPPRTHEPPPGAVMMASLEFTGVMDRDRFTMDPPPAASDQGMTVTVANKPAIGTDEDVRSKARPPARKVHLRIVRDSNLCSKPECSKWHLIHADKPHSAMIDLAQLRLAPSLRNAVANGEVELIIDSVERHKTIKGRNVVAVIPMNLSGVTPHEGAPLAREQEAGASP